MIYCLGEQAKLDTPSESSLLDVSIYSKHGNDKPVLTEQCDGNHQASNSLSSQDKESITISPIESVIETPLPTSADSQTEHVKKQVTSAVEKEKQGADDSTAKFPLPGSETKEATEKVAGVTEATGNEQEVKEAQEKTEDTSKLEKELASAATAGADSDKDMPSFDEWKQKMLADKLNKMDGKCSGCHCKCILLFIQNVW